MANDVEQSWLGEGNYDVDQTPVTDNYEARPIPVHIKYDETQSSPPQLCIHSNVPIPQAGSTANGSQPNIGRVLPHNYHRFKAQIQVTPGAGCTAVVTSYKIDSLTN